MIGAPPGGGLRSRIGWIAGLVSYVVALPAGAAVSAFGLYLIGKYVWHPAYWSVGAVALISVLAGIGIIPVGLVESKWAVPRSWQRVGHVAYAAIFGAVLGFGVLTPAASLSWYTVLWWAPAARSWPLIWMVFCCFAVCRAAPMLAVAIAAAQRHEYPANLVGRFTRAASALVPVEIMALTAVGIVLVFTR